MTQCPMFKKTSQNTDGREPVSRLVIVQKRARHKLYNCLTVRKTVATINVFNDSNVILILHLSHPPRWASYQGTTCVPGAWTLRCGSAPCRSFCLGSAPPPWLTAESACAHTSSQTPQSRCRSPRTPRVRWPSSFCSSSRGSRPLAHATSSTSRGQFSPMRPSISLLTARPKYRWATGISLPHRGRSTWRRSSWGSVGPKPPSCSSWWCESESGRGFSLATSTRRGSKWTCFSEERANGSSSLRRW